MYCIIFVEMHASDKKSAIYLQNEEMNTNKETKFRMMNARQTLVSNCDTFSMIQIYRCFLHR